MLRLRLGGCLEWRHRCWCGQQPVVATEMARVLFGTLKGGRHAKLVGWFAALAMNVRASFC